MVFLIREFILVLKASEEIKENVKLCIQCDRITVHKGYLLIGKNLSIFHCIQVVPQLGILHKRAVCIRKNLNSRGAFKSSNLTFYNGNAIADYMIDCWVFTGAAEPKQIDGEANRNLLQSIRDYKRDIAAKEHVAAEEQRAKAHRMAAEYKRQIMPYITSNDWNEADKFAAEALSNLPEGDAFLYYVRAKAYYLNNLDFEVEDSENMTDYFKAYRREAEHLAELCRKSITCDPSDGNEAYFYRGLAYIVLGRANDAANDFMRCARGNESIKAVCYYNVGIAYKNAGRYNAALDQFKNARQYFSDADNKERCLRKIKECQQKISGK